MQNLINIQPRLPYNPKLNQRATEMRKNMTKPEQIIRFNYLKKLDIGVLKQRPIGNFIVDFYIPSKMIVIEIDGDIHYTDNALAYDEERTAILEGFGLKVIRFTNTEIIDNFEFISSKLNKILK